VEVSFSFVVFLLVPVLFASYYVVNKDLSELQKIIPHSSDFCSVSDCYIC